jgi:hypothetical protein
VWWPADPGVVQIRRSVVWGLFVVGFGLAYILGGQLLHDLAEGMDRAHLALWKMELPLVTLLVAVAAAFIRRKAEVCERGHDAGLWHPIRAPKAAEILAGEGTTRRVALRTLGASGATWRRRPAASARRC